VRFAWDGYRLLQETDDTTGEVCKTLWGRGWETIAYQRSGDNHANVHPLYLHRDIKDWLTAITTRHGAICEQYRYTTYGEVSLLDAAGAPLDRPARTPWLWHGYYADGETGQFYVIHRYYAPGQGRWLSRDPAHLEPRMVAFGCNPIEFVDPLAACG
jgi:RHS repeat-associated protein